MNGELCEIALCLPYSSLKDNSAPKCLIYKLATTYIRLYQIVSGKGALKEEDEVEEEDVDRGIISLSDQNKIFNELCPGFLIVITCGGRILQYVSGNVERLAGLQPDDLIGSLVSDKFHQNDTQLIRDILSMGPASDADTDPQHSFFYRLRNQDSRKNKSVEYQLMYCEAKVQFINTHNPPAEENCKTQLLPHACLGLIGISYPVPILSMSEIEKRYDSFSFKCNLEGRILESCAGAERLLGFSSDQLTEMTLYTLATSEDVELLLLTHTDLPIDEVKTVCLRLEGVEAEHWVILRLQLVDTFKDCLLTSSETLSCYIHVDVYILPSDSQCLYFEYLKSEAIKGRVSCDTTLDKCDNFLKKRFHKKDEQVELSTDLNFGDDVVLKDNRRRERLRMTATHSLTNV